MATEAHDGGKTPPQWPALHRLLHLDLKSTNLDEQRAVLAAAAHDLRQRDLPVGLRWVGCAQYVQARLYDHDATNDPGAALDAAMLLRATAQFTDRGMDYSPLIEAGLLLLLSEHARALSGGGSLKWPVVANALRNFCSVADEPPSMPVTYFLLVRVVDALSGADDDGEFERLEALQIVMSCLARSELNCDARFAGPAVAYARQAIDRIDVEYQRELLAEFVALGERHIELAAADGEHPSNDVIVELAAAHAELALRTAAPDSERAEQVLAMLPPEIRTPRIEGNLYSLILARAAATDETDAVASARARLLELAAAPGTPQETAMFLRLRAAEGLEDLRGLLLQQDNPHEGHVRSRLALELADRFASTKEPALLDEAREVYNGGTIDVTGDKWLERANAVASVEHAAVEHGNDVSHLEIGTAAALFVARVRRDDAAVGRALSMAHRWLREEGGNDKTLAAIKQAYDIAEARIDAKSPVKNLVIHVGLDLLNLFGRHILQGGAATLDEYEEELAAWARDDPDGRRAAASKLQTRIDQARYAEYGRVDRLAAGVERLRGEYATAPEEVDLDAFSTLLRYLGQEFGDLGALREALTIADEAVAREPESEESSGIRMAALLDIAQVTRDGDLVREAQLELQRAMSFPLDYVVRLDTLRNGAVLYRIAYSLFGDRRALDNALALSSKALVMAFERGVDTTPAFISLAASVSAFDQAGWGRLNVADEARDLMHDVLRSLPPDHSLYASGKARLAALAPSRNVDGWRPDLHSLAAAVRGRKPLHDLDSAMAWCRDAATRAARGEPGSGEEARAAALQALDALRRVAAAQPAAQDISTWSAHSDGLPATAAYVIAQHDPADAVEFLELARAIALRRPQPSEHSPAMEASPAVPAGDRHYLAATEHGGVLLARPENGDVTAHWLPGMTEQLCLEHAWPFIGRLPPAARVDDAYLATVEAAISWMGSTIGDVIAAATTAGPVRVVPVGVTHYLPLALARCSDGSHLCDHRTLVVSPLELPVPASLPRIRSSVSVIDPALPTSRREAAEVAAAIGSGTTFSTDSSKAAVLDALASADVLHFACHGYISNTSPWLSWLRLANNERLTVNELSGATLQTPDLALLSGCWSGSQGIRAIDEAVSFATVCLVAGAREALAARWPVRDSVAHEVAVSVAQSVAGQPGSGAQALVRLQAQALASFDRADPESLARLHSFAAFEVSAR